MTPLTITCACACLLSVALPEVSAWTIDLPEARKYFFEKADRYKTEEKLKEERRLYVDNVEPDSRHNEHELSNAVHGRGYADDYQYVSYMEKKVHGIVHNGSVYLEGLRAALHAYDRLLRACGSANFTQSQSPNGPWLQPNRSGSVGNQPGFFGNQSGSNGNQFGSSGIQSGSFGNQSGSISNQSGSSGNQPGNVDNQPGSYGNQTGSFSSQNGPFNGTALWDATRLDRATCERATRGSQHVRRLAELALWATRELQDRHYAHTYDHQTREEEEEEAELLVRLAFFLDRLALLTGFEPQPHDYVTPTPTRSSPTTPSPFSVMGEVPEDVKTMMMNCLQTNSSEPTMERCRYPLPYPEFIKRLFNMSDPPDLMQPVSTESYEPKDPSFMETMKNPTQRPTTLSRERRRAPASDLDRAGKTAGGRDKRGFLMNALLGQRLAHKILDGVHEELETEHFGDLHLRTKLFEKLAILRNSHKKLFELMAAIRHRHELLDKLEKREGFAEGEGEGKGEGRHKRSADNPMVKFIKFYVKHKIWSNANQEIPGDLDVANRLSDRDVNIVTDEYETTIKPDLTKIRKRSIDNKKYVHMKLPQNPIQDISNYVKYKKGVNCITDENQKHKLRQFLDKIQHSKSSTAKTYAQKMLKRQRRSTEYERKFRPSSAENPRQDIGYYVKSAPGRERARSSGPERAAQAARVRAGLQQAFRSSDIEVVRRYGANVNPLIPYPLGYGMVQSFFVDL